MIISVHQGVTIMPQWRMATPVNFEMDNGEHIAIVGPNGSGKSMLVDIITGAHPLIGQRVAYDFCPTPSARGIQHAGDALLCQEGGGEGEESPRPKEARSVLASDNIRHITFRDSYGSAADAGYYLQQRWNQTEIDEELPTVDELLKRVQSCTSGQKEHLCRIFGLTHLLDKPLILLSSGELRRFVLCRALLAQPRVLIIDNPFIGLDAATRRELKELLCTLSREGDLQIIVVVARDADIPDFITHVVPVDNMKVLPKMTRESYSLSPRPLSFHQLSTFRSSLTNALPTSTTDHDTTMPHEVVCLRKVSIKYGERTILKDLDWTVMSGERWALTGQNGAGKSTLLSLVCADNPQSYACDISLFGHRRGTGESIWEIKRHIGYVSPELHRAYNRDLPAISIVASGLKDTAGGPLRPTSADREVSRRWMAVMGIEHLAERTFLRLSSGEQRMVLLARAFVKDPALLILDEPLHGLDAVRSAHVRAVIDAFCQRPGKTLIMVSHYEEDFPSCITHRLHLTRHS